MSTLAAEVLAGDGLDVSIARRARAARPITAADRYRYLLLCASA
jgi:hypothetical protein